ncbi:MAG: hypothetical protein WAQ28_08170 [Bacteroidia bacterium]|jgi:hypothetical protein
MKKIFIPILATGIFFYSCSNSHTETPQTETPPADTAKAPADTVATAATPAKSFDVIGSELLQNETFGNIKIGLTAAQTQEALGKPEKKGEKAEWEADGETHQKWNYKGIELDMIGKEQQTIASISITAPSTLKTSKNIGIGSPKAEVETAYAGMIDKSATDEGSENIIAGTMYGGIIFQIENGKVKEIFAGAAAE